MNDVIFLILANCALIFAVLLALWKSWLDYLRPDLFYIFRIYENNFLNYREYKYFIPFAGDLDKREIKGSEYDRTGFKPYINPKGVYEWNFEKGNQIPLQFNTENKIDGAGIIESRKKDYYKMMIKGERGIEDYVPYIIIGLVVLVLIVIFYFMNKQAQTSQQQMQVLYNITRSL